MLLDIKILITIIIAIIITQDILDAWLRCQESWLYLEPIFNSEDIMKQMPVEGRKFNKVNIFNAPKKP